MKIMNLLLGPKWVRGGLVAALTGWVLTVRAQTPATLTDLGGTTPTPGVYDVSQLSTAGEVDMPAGLNYYTDEQSNHSGGEPGQTFTTPGLAASYVLNSVAIKTGGGTTSNTGAQQGYLLHLYSVAGGTATLLATYSAANFAFTDGDWLRWSGLNLSLNANTVYGYSFGKLSSATSGWEAMGNAGGNLYPGGELGLLPVAGGTINFGNSQTYDAVFDIGLTANGPPAAPVVTNAAASAIQATAATLNGKLVSLGGSLPQVTIYYGLTNGGTNAAAWANAVALGYQSNSFAAMVTGLLMNTTYYFTATATNITGGAWAAPSKSFTTLTESAPTVTNLPATGIAAVIATLNGQVLNTGNQWPAVTVYYGTMDGGTNPAAWASQISLGAQSGGFNAQVAGLTAGTTYYFTTFAANPAGAAWGGPSKTFTTLTVQRVAVTTFHYDNTRQGQNTNETLLTLANVNVTNFGKLFTYAVDGYVYAQPLIMTNLSIPGRGVRDVLLVATMHDTIYAFDANSNGDPNGGLLWQTNLGLSAVCPSPDYGARYHSQGDTDVTPEEGAMGTPVIDPVAGTLDVDTFTRAVVAGVSTNYFHHLHALGLTNGAERPFSPVLVTASVPGTGVEGNGKTVTFLAIQQMQRPALTLAGGVLYAAYGSYADTDPYHGWILGYNATNLAPLNNYIFNTTPNATTAAFGGNAGEGGLWMGGGGLCVDANTNLFFETANGSFSAYTNGGDYADSFVRLTTANGLAVADYFTPYNQASMQAADSDLGSGASILLPDAAGSAAHPHLILGAGKAGTIYLVDRANMGHYNTGSSDSQIVQSFGGAIGGAGSFATPAYFNYRLFYTGNGDNVRAYTVTNGLIGTTAQSVSPASLGAFTGSPVVSANGTSNAIVWVTDPGAYASSGPAVLHAYNATNLALELYNSSQNLARDNPGGAVKMTAPVVAGGKVYVGAEYALSVYGPEIFLPAPTLAPAGGAFTNSVTITLADATAGVAIYYTLDGTTPTTASPLYTGPFNLTSNALVQALATAPGAVNSAVAGASFVNTAAAGTGSGLLGQYWTNTTSATFTNVTFNAAPTLTRTDAVVNFNWGATGPSPVVGGTNFTARWTGTVQPQYNERYTFSATVSGGVRLWLNGRLLINEWVNAAATTYQASLNLNAQQLYNLQMDYFQSTGGAEAMLAWSSPSTPAAIVPQTQLYPYTNPPPAVVWLSPANNASSTASASVTLSADADAPYNPISVVNFYTNSVLLGGVTNPPYTLTATGLGAGGYALTAVAVDGSGLSSTTAPVNLTVAAGTGLAYGLTSNAPISAFLNMPTTFNGTLPPLLSETGVYTNTPNRIPAPGLIPYVPITPLWSDGASKSRYLAVPNNGGVITPNQQITFAPTGSWSFPAGTIFVKNFDLVVNTTNASVPLQRLETRLLVRDVNGAVYGVTYKWRADNSDADLLTSSLNEAILITNATGISTQTWYYPSPADCLTCHTPVANYVLGVNTRQLNGNQTYPATGVTDNQLRTLNRLGLFNPAFDEAGITNFEQLASLTNLSASLQQRSRSYLDANCAQCHQPGGTGITFDARYDTPLAEQDITTYPAAFSLGYDHACIVKAEDVWRSMIWERMNTTNATAKMPPLARNLIDTNGVAVMGQWINSLPGLPALAPPGITPNGGSFIGSIGVTLSPPDTNATLYYTLDGSLPTTNSSVYSGSFNLFSNATVSANAFETGYNNSVAAGALFLVQPLYFTAENFLTNQQLQLGFSGVPGSNYVLQATTNFTTWTPLSTNTAGTNLLEWVDPGATNYPYRFYRVLQP